jgi:hypothetical protein
VSAGEFLTSVTEVRKCSLPMYWRKAILVASSNAYY